MTTKAPQMLLFAITKCKQCSATIQGEGTPKSVLSERLCSTFRSAKAINRMRLVCKGQGTCYATLPWDAEPTDDTHFVFAGMFADMCCHCARSKGWNELSFLALGCTECKSRRRPNTRRATEN